MKLRITTILATLALSGMAFSASPADDLLSGPTLEKEEVTNEDMLSRKMQEMGKSTKLDAHKQHRTWLKILRTIELSEEQQVSIRTLLKELQVVQGEFQKTYGKEVKEFRQKKRSMNQMEDTMSDDDRKRMMELLTLAPDVKVYQEKAWVLLTVDQQNTFKTNYQKHLEEEAKRREEMKGKQHPQKDGKGRGFGPGDSPSKERGKRPSDKDD
jgi:hypothetical protein